MITALPSKRVSSAQGIDPALIERGEYSLCECCSGYVHKDSWSLHWDVMHGIKDQRPSHEVA